ncbi:hypothetical protein L9F63_021094, partial [Diploptera punctata]
ELRNGGAPHHLLNIFAFFFLFFYETLVILNQLEKMLQAYKGRYKVMEGRIWPACQKSLLRNCFANYMCAKKRL